MFSADLHCHSHYSDGSLSPEDLIDLAKQTGLNGLSITDHDTVAAYPRALDKALQAKIDLIPGVEFSCDHRSTSVHILGYAFSTNNKELLAFCQKHSERRKKRTKAILEQLAREGMQLKEEDIKNHGSIGRPHIAKALMEKGYISSFEEAFKKFLAQGKPCYVKADAFTVTETIDVIHQAGGVAVIAHPHLVKNKKIIQEMLEMDFDGLEGYYSLFDRKNNQQWIDIAEKKNWIVTGGSDFHGVAKPHIHLGCAFVRENCFQLLKNHYLKNL